jgi:putative cell wall-binding protein
MKSNRMRSTRRVAAGIAALLAAGTLAGVTPDARAVEGFALTRVAGANRYATAASLAAAAFPGGSTVAVLASGENFPDALAGSYLAGRFGSGSPILLTTRDALPAETKKALDDLGVDTVYLLGGTAAISETVAEALGERTVVRVAGNNRYETAADIATLEAEGAAAPGQISGANTVIIASGEGFADALASGPLAFKGKLPVLLTPAAALHDAASAAIDDLEATRAIVAGGTAAVSAAVVTELEGKGMTVQRVAGANRYATGVALANLGRTSLALSASTIDIASGENFPDALAAGPASGVANRPLLLTAGDELSEATEDYLVANSDTLTSGRVFGGTAAISETAVNQAESAAATGVTLGATRVVSTNKGSDEYTVVVDGTDDPVVIEYDDNDDFIVDGQDATKSGFEANLGVGDIVVIDDVEDPDEHDLTNVGSGSFTSGTIGNVDIEDDQFDFIDPVTGNAFRTNVTYSGTFRVDAGTATMADFEAAVNEGDTVAIESGAFNLTNVVVTGEATNVDVTDPSSGDPGSPKARFNVDALGDKYETSSDPNQLPEDSDGNDDQYEADGNPLVTTQAFEVDGSASDYDGFAGTLTEGDQVTYQRKGGVETFTVVNSAQATVTGQAIDGIETDGDTLAPNTQPGGSFSIVDEDGEEVAVDYEGGGTFVVDEDVVDEADFESNYSAGDIITFRPADTASSTAQRVELENENLEGTAGSVNTSNNPVLDDEYHTPPAEDPANSYGVLAEDNPAIELAQVNYEEGGAHPASPDRQHPRPVAEPA